ncbi:MAG: ammonia-forming cytochrome c nitrite reductase subunit c552 [Candidatus Sumerlaeia bacterium]
MPSDEKQSESKSPMVKKVFVLLVIAAALSFLGIIGIAALLVTIVQHKAEAANPFFRVVELDETISDPAVWGKNFPLQYDQYKRTVDMERTRFGGSESLPRTPTGADPREVVTQSVIEEVPRLKILWAGYSFAVDYREDRGHAYMLEDQTLTQRQLVVDQPGTCLNCHASMVIPYRKAGDGDLMAGFDAINAMPYDQAAKMAKRAIACIDCHDPKTMALRVTRPAFINSLRAYKASRGVEDYDVNRDATHQEMRAYVCAQCHVEYYFKGEGKTLTYPWNNGIKADQILAYYEESGFKDWTHKTTGAAGIKAQHPEFETWSQGIHSRAGVSCADCHMPYMRVGAQKISDHHVNSPLLKINRSCQTCHRESEEEMKARAENIQAKSKELQDIALGANVALIRDIEKAIEAGVAEEKIEAARGFQRKASFLIDFFVSENSMGFHAPQETARITTLSVDYARQGQEALR